MPDTFTPTLHLFGDDKHAPGSPEYRRVAEEAAQDAIADWLQGVDADRMHLFAANGVECALECCPGHWGEQSRWRWGRVDAGDPDEDESGENVLLLVALGCRLAPGVRRVRRRAALPPYAEGALSPDEIDDFLSVGRTILLSGAGHPARATLAAGCWLARHGPKERGSRAARERMRLGWLGAARAATSSRVTRSAWNFGEAGRAFVGAWPSGKEGEPVRTHLELLEADEVYPWATADYWLSVLPTVRVYPEGRQGHRVDAPVVDGKQISDGARVDLTLIDLHAGTWTGERTLLLLNDSVVVFMSPYEQRDPVVQARRQRRSEWFTFQAGNRHYSVQFLPMRCLEG